MKVIGLCGGSGSGKAAVSALFLKQGIPSIDTDGIYRELTSKDSACLRALSLEFGEEIISTDGSLNRKALSKIVFTGDGAKSRLTRLNEISHKFILDEARARLTEYQKQGVKAAIVDAPVLFESGFNTECDVIVAVLADKEVRVNRIMLRDGIDRESAISRINSQLTDEWLASHADYVIENNSDLATLENRVCEVARLILNN